MSPPDAIVATPAPAPSRRPILWAALAGGVLALAGVIVAATVGSSGSGAHDEAAENDEDGSACADLDALAGSWVFTTITTDARQKKRVGSRGFYELEVRVSDCQAEIDLVNVGRSGALVYDEERKQLATATLARGEGAEAFGFSALIEPRNAAGQGIPKRMTFAVDGDRLVGTWRQRGEHWLEAGKFGVLEGHRTGDPREIKPRRRAMPCLVKCAAPKTLEEAEAEPDSAAVEACRSACE